MSAGRRLATAALAAAFLFVLPNHSTLSDTAQYANNEIVFIDALVEIEIYGYGAETYQMSGTWEISYSDPIVAPDDHIIIESEILAMELKGEGAEINLNGGLPSPGSTRSIDPGIDFPAESFFDVYFEVELTGPMPGEILTNPVPEHVMGVIDDFPPYFDPYNNPGAPTPLLNDLAEEVGTIRFIQMDMLPYYPPEVHIILDRAKGSDILEPFEDNPDLFRVSGEVSGPYEPVEAIFSYREAGSPDPWTVFDTDLDGSAPSMSTIADKGSGDGWTGYLDRWSFPPDGAWYELQVTMDVPDLGTLIGQSPPVYIDPYPAIPEFVQYDPDSVGYVKPDSLIILLVRMIKYIHLPALARIQIFPLGLDFKRPLTPVNQLAIGNTDANVDSMSCGPASAASCLKYFADKENGYPGLDNPNGNEAKPNQTGEQMARELGVAMGANATKGADHDGMVAGIKSYLSSHGQSGWTVEKKMIDDYQDIGDMFDEFEADSEDVMMTVQNVLPNGDTVSHCVTLGSKGSTVYETEQGPVQAMCVSYRLDFMDPWGGGTTENNEYNVSYDSEGKPRLEGYKVSDDATENARITGFVKVSPPSSGGSNISSHAPPADDPGWIIVDAGVLQGGGIVDTFHWDSTGFPGGLYLLEVVSETPDGQECRDLRMAGIPEYTVDADPPMPDTPTKLLGSYPNPFNPTTTIEFYVASETKVDITIYDAAGRTIRRLVRGRFYPAGRHHASWNGISDSGSKVASGVYFYRFEADGAAFTSKLVLLK